MGLLEEQLKEAQRATASVGVTPDMVSMANTPQEDLAASLLPVPKSPLEKVMERDGRGKTIGKMILGAYTGMTPLLMPELFTGREKYKADMKLYAAQQAREANQALSEPHYGALSDEDATNDLPALRRLAVLQPEVYGGVLKDFEKNRLAPNPATYTEGDYQFVNDEWNLVQQASDGTVKYTPMGPDFKPTNRLPSGEYIEKRGSFFNQEAQDSAWRADDIKNLGVQMDEIGEEAWRSGLAGQVSETWKRATGTEDVQSMVKKKYDGIRVSKAISNLPPGVASDKDIELALQPFPTSFTNYQQLRDYVSALERAERKLSAYATHASQYVFENGTESGMREAWKPKWEAMTSPGGRFYEGTESTGVVSIPEKDREGFEEWLRTRNQQ